MTSIQKNISVKTAVLIGICLYLFLPFVSHGYTLLAPLPGIETISTSGDGLFARYVTSVFRIALGLAALLSVVMIVIAGVEYTTTFVSESAKSDAKDRIWSAIIGFLLLLSSYLIFYEINPSLIDLRLVIPPLTVGSGGGGEGTAPGTSGDSSPPGSSPTSGQFGNDVTSTEATAREREVRDYLANQSGGNITINDGTDCMPENGTLSGCRTQVGGLKPKVVAGVLTIQKDCGCELVITGGNELGHAACGARGTCHAHGDKVDIRSTTSVDPYMTQVIQEGTRVNPGSTGYPIYENADKTYRIIDERSSSRPHWDIEML